MIDSSKRAFVCWEQTALVDFNIYCTVYIYTYMYYDIFSITGVCFLGVCWGRFVALEGLEAQKGQSAEARKLKF